MGIPFYFKSLISRYPEIINHPPVRCKRLYLDYNCIIHMCAAKQAPVENYQDAIIEASLAYIEQVMAATTPEELLYIAVDGTCPRAKMQQQRKRRYMSHWRQQKICEMGVAPTPHMQNWNSDVVTPGTDFMVKFDKRLIEHTEVLRRKYKGVTVIASTSGEFGEGEHKIFEHMVGLPQDDDDTVNVVYGLDADLIMLSVIQKRKLMLLREVPEFNIASLRNTVMNNEFLLLNIELLKRYLVDECLMGDAMRLNDYVMLCTLIGNDFIPPLSYLKIKTDGIELLLKTYKDLVEEKAGGASPYLVVSTDGGNKLNQTMLLALLSKLSNREDEMMREVDAAYYNKRAFIDHKQRPEARIDSHPTIHKHPRVIDVSLPNWRLSYYKHMFNDPHKDITHKACERYAEGFMWVFEYYFTRNHNCGWYYPFHYSPTVLDLHNYLLASHAPIDCVTRAHSTHMEFMECMKKPQMQLLMVLPLHSKSLLTKTLHPIVDDITQGCVQYFPLRFNITSYLKTYLWECSAILPDINIQKLSTTYDNLIQQPSQPK